jgi:hypothetical protein
MTRSEIDRTPRPYEDDAPLAIGGDERLQFDRAECLTLGDCVEKLVTGISEGPAG